MHNKFNIVVLSILYRMIIVIYILLLMNRTVEIYKLDYFVYGLYTTTSTLISWLCFKITNLVAQ